MKSQKRIGLDIDDTLALFMGTFLAEYNAKLGSAYTQNDITDWSTWKMPISLDEFVKEHDSIWKNRWQTVKPSVSRDLLFELTEKYHVDILTHRPAEHQPYMRKWLGMYFPKVELGVVCVKSAEEKLHSGYDILFDDGNPLAEELIRNEKSTKVILYLVEQPWNRNKNYGEGAPETPCMIWAKA